MKHKAGSKSTVAPCHGVVIWSSDYCQICMLFFAFRDLRNCDWGAFGGGVSASCSTGDVHIDEKMAMHTTGHSQRLLSLEAGNLDHLAR